MSFSPQQGRRAIEIRPIRPLDRAAPELERVAQVLGRMVRSVEDRGGALLEDPRYASSAWRDLLRPRGTITARPHPIIKTFMYVFIESVYSPG